MTLHTPPPPSAREPEPASSHLQRMGQRGVRAFHRYATWLVSISWKRFVLLALLLMIAAGILQGIPPFSWTTEVLEEMEPAGPATPPAARKPAIRIDKPAPGSATEGLDIAIDARGIRITPRPASAPAAAPAQAASAVPDAGASSPAPAPAQRQPLAAASTAASAATGDAGERQISVQISVPGGVASDAVREALQEAAREIRDALQDAQEEARPAKAAPAEPQRRVRHLKRDSFLTDLAALWILISIIIKITYKGQLQAREQAARATETAEAEQLKRQVVEARMAAMQAQVEPHFLFNTLASIDHLIETDPPRASRMQKSLIALLRATLPSLREGQAGPRTLGQELAVIEPYLEILKVRMEERLHAVIDVPEGLRSAEMPPLMIQGLVENAIKHGLEPQPQGGELTVKAEVVHGQLVITVQDSGVGLGASPASGTGTGLANIRERLALLYGLQARVDVGSAPAGGTVARVTLPYRTVGPAPQPRP